MRLVALLGLILTILLGVAVMCAGIFFVVFNLTAGLSDNADNLFAVARSGDYEAARRYLSSDLAERTDAADLRTYLEDNGLDQVVQTAWNSRQVSGDQGTLEGKVTTASGVQMAVRVELVKQQQAWKVRVMEKVGEATPAPAAAAASAPPLVPHIAAWAPTPLPVPAAGQAPPVRQAPPAWPSVLGGLLLLAVFLVGLVWGLKRLTDGFAGVGTAFFAALTRHDLAAACQLVTAEFLAATGQAGLQAWLAGNGLSQVRGSHWYGRSWRSGRGFLHGEVAVAAGAPVPMWVALVKQDGAWRIHSLHRPKLRVAAFLRQYRFQSPGVSP